MLTENNLEHCVFLRQSTRMLPQASKVRTRVPRIYAPRAVPRYYLILYQFAHPVFDKSASNQSVTSIRIDPCTVIHFKARVEVLVAYGKETSINLGSQIGVRINGCTDGYFRGWF